MKVKKGKDEKIFLGISYVLVTLFAVLCLLPFYLILVGSFTRESVILTEGYSFFLAAESFSAEAYRMAFKSPDTIVKAYGITLFVTVTGTLAAVFLSAMTGYVLARPDFPWRNQASFFFFFTTLFSGGLVPWYLMCSRFFKFNNHIYSLILPCLFSVWNMIIAKSFMKGIPFEMTEAAKVDGAGDFYTFRKIILPTAKPLVATLGLFTALTYWNDWYNCMLFMTDENKFMLQYYLQRILGSAEAMRIVAEKSGMALPTIPLESMKMAMTVIATGPIVLLYPFVQRYFVKGLTIGAVKG